MARAGVEPTTLRLKVIDSTKAPSRPTRLVIYLFSSHIAYLTIYYTYNSMYSTR